MELTTFPGDFRAFKVLITAGLAGVNVNVNEADSKAAQAVETLPTLTTSQGVLSQSNAIARYVARSRPEAGLLGSSFFQSGEVDSWIEWGTNNVELPGVLTTYMQFGWIDFNYQVNKKSLADLETALGHLEAHLLSRTFLVGQRLTLADVIVASQLFYPFKLNLDNSVRSKFPSTMRWFLHVMAQPAANSVVGAVTLCKVAPKPPKNNNNNSKKNKKKKNNNNNQPKKANQPKKPSQPKKPKKPKNPLDLLPKTNFDLEEWKRQYSNARSDYFKSMEWFWPNFDADGWSIWLQEFNHNDENTTDFIVCNKMEGYVQRTIGIQKYAFGVMQMLDTMEKKGFYTVSGIWLIRGLQIEPMLDVNPESGVYTWSKLDHNDEATKKRIAQYWCGETDIDGADCYDAKVFK
jgi:elongation factor 1-gamma